MTTQEVRDRVNKIETSSCNDEVAHSMEDVLHREVLQAIAFDESIDDVTRRALAKEALETLTLDFARWCA